MSEKLSSSEPAVKSDEELKESIRGSKELIWKENEPKRTMEYVEATEHSIMHGSEYRSPDLKDSECIQFRKLAGLPEPLIENSEGARICSYPCSSKKMKQIPEDSDDPKDLEVLKICQLSETTSEISTSNKPEDPEDPEVVKICSYPCSSKKKKQIPEDSDDPKDLQVLKICQLSESTSEISTSNKSEDPEDPEVAKICSYPCSSKKKKQIPEDSDDPKDPEVPKICKLPKITSEIFTFKLEEPEVSKICQLPKTTSEISTSIKEDIPKVPKVCQLPETSEISTSVKFETSEIPDVCTTLPLKISSVKFTDPEISECQLPKAMSEISTAIKLETSKIPEIYQLPKIESECSTKSMVTYESKVPKASQLRKTMSEISTSSKPEAMSEIPTSIKLETSKIPEIYQLPKTESEISTSSKPEDPKIPELRRKDSMTELFTLKRGAFKEVCEFPTCKIPTSNKPKDSETLKKEGSLFGISQQTMERIPYYVRPPKFPHESDREYRIRLVKQIKPLEEQIRQINCCDNEHEKIKILTSWISHDKLGSFKKSEESSLPDDEDKTELLPIVSGERPFDTLNRFWGPLGSPNFMKRPFVLATYQLVPSLPIGLFEMFAEIIECVTRRQVVLLHEGKFHRPIPSEIADIVIMPAAYNWDEGVLLPASFVFKHEQNKDKTANVYTDVVVRNDCNPYIKSIIDLRGYTFVLPIYRNELTCSDLLFNFLHAKGENLLFFGNILDAKTQIDVLDMVANNRAQAGVLDSPVVESNKYNMQGVTMKSLRILSSLGPLPPYRIMIKKTLADELVDKLANYLLTSLCDLWLQRLLPYGVLGFAENSMDKYEYLDPKAATRKPSYY